MLALFLALDQRIEIGAVKYNPVPNFRAGTGLQAMLARCPALSDGRFVLRGEASQL